MFDDSVITLNIFCITIDITKRKSFNQSFETIIAFEFDKKMKKSIILMLRLATSLHNVCEIPPDLLTETEWAWFVHELPSVK